MANTKVDLLTDVLDYATQQSVYSFSTGVEFDQSYSLTDSIVAVGGRDYGYDALRNNAAPVAPRKTAWRFIHKYAVGESWTTLKDAMTLAFGHGRPFYLQKIRPDGTILIAEARLAEFPDKAVTDTTAMVDFTVTFQQREDWKAKDLTSPRYDTGLHYDGGLHYDQRGQPVALTGTQTTFTLINSGTVNERGALIVCYGPINGAFTLVNNACDARGVPFPAGVIGTPLSLTVNVTLAAGEYLAIDSDTDAVTSNQAGIVPWALVTRAPGQRSYWEIVPGANPCYMNEASFSAGGSIMVAARSRWRS